MTAKQTIQMALATSEGALLNVLEEMKDSPTTFPTAKGGCHALWVLGHLALVEGHIPGVLYGRANPVAQWEPLFGDGSQPVSDPARYPDYETLLAKYHELRSHNLGLLEALSEEDLDRPTASQPKGLEHFFQTFGQSFLTVALHQMSHRSHVTDAKRSAGRIGASTQAA